MIVTCNHTALMLLQYANDLETAVKIWDMNSVRCVWSINENSVLAVYKIYVAAASSTLFVGHSLGKVSVYRLHTGSATELGCRRKADGDNPVTIPAQSSQVSASPFVVSDLGSAISDEGIFECHSSSANIVRNPTFAPKSPDHHCTAMSSGIF